MARRWRSPLESTWSQRATSSRRARERAEADPARARPRRRSSDTCSVGLGIEQRALERAERQVALLRRDHHAARRSGMREAAARARPQARQHAHQHRLAGAGLAADVHGLAGRDGEVGARRSAAGRCRRRSRSRRGARRRAARRTRRPRAVCAAISASMASQAVDDVHDAAGRGVPLGDAVVVVDHPGDGDLHLDEGGGELRHLAQRQVAARCTSARRTAAARWGSSGPEALVIQVRWPCCQTIAIQRATTVS